MNGTLNVVTGFALGITYDFNDPEFKKIAGFVEVRDFIRILIIFFFT